MAVDVYLTKGMRVRAQWFKAKELGTYSLTGMQPKLAVDGVEVVGVITHIRGDHPTNPTQYGIWIKPDDSEQEVVVKPEWIREVETPNGVAQRKSGDAIELVPVKKD